VRTGGWGKHNILFLGGAFRKAKYEIRRRRKSEGGQKFLPPNPLPFCPPEHTVWRAKRAVSSVQKRFGFRQTNAPVLNFQEFCRLIQPREARQRTETLARRAQRGSPSAGSLSLAILSICFA
jgi:hypothetical protein